MLNFPNLAGKNLNFPNLAGKIWKIQDLATHQSLTRCSNSRRITHQLAGPQDITIIVKKGLPKIFVSEKRPLESSNEVWILYVLELRPDP